MIIGQYLGGKVRAKGSNLERSLSGALSGENTKSLKNLLEDMEERTNSLKHILGDMETQ